MDSGKVFHMTGGTGPTSYTENSSLQKKAADMVKNITLETVEELYVATKPKCLGIADLGCSSGPNTLSIIRDIIGSVQDASNRTMSRPPDSIHVYLNDLPTNDFNSICKLLPDFSRNLSNSSMVFVGAYPGTFYHRLFPDSSIHFVYSSYSLHWLSNVPLGLYDEQGRSMNKDAIYITEKSPKGVEEAYAKQFEDDFSKFLRLRSEEMVSEGRMVLIFSGREGRDHLDRGNSFIWQLFWRSFAILISLGVVDQEKVDSYDVHYYAPCKEEIEEVVKRDGRFKLDRIEMFAPEIAEKGILTTFGTRVARTVRSIQESMISDHFGHDILDSLFEIYGKIMDSEMALEEIRPVTFQIVLKKL